MSIKVNGIKIAGYITGLKGDPGETPYIGANGNWWIGETDTGVSASGSSGESSGVTMEEVNAAIDAAITGAMKEGY